MAGSGRLTTTFDRGVTSARPQVNTPFVDIAQGLRPIGQMVGGMIDNAREKAMVKSGTAEGQAAANTQIAGGLPDMNFSLLDEVFAPARVDAAQKAYSATIKTDIDSQEEALRVKHALDPEGYKAATQRMISGFIQGSPHDMAMDVGAYARAKVSDGLSAVSKARIERDQVENVNAVKTRVGKLESDLLADAGTYGTAQWEAKFGEWKSAQIAMANNPLFSWTPEQALAAEDRLLEGVQTELMTQGALEAYRAKGGGLQGRIAALRTVDRALGYEDPNVSATYAPRGSVTYAPPVTAAPGSAYGAPRPSGPHNGVDYPAPIGTPVAAIAPGKVVAVSEGARSGKFVRVLHDDGTISGYAHLSSQDVKRGDTIAPGQIIGKVGNTGNSTGPHLHLTVRDRSDKTIDPTTLFGKPAQDALAGGPPVEDQGPPADSPLASLPPARRRKIWTTVRSEINAVSAADIEQARLDEQEREAARRAQREQRDIYRLAIIDGTDTGEWKKDATLSDADRAMLYTAENTARSRERTEAARDAREAKADRRAGYLKYESQARDGLLTDAALADAVESGEINKVDRQNLVALRNKGLKLDVSIMEQGAGTALLTKPSGMSKGDYAALKSKWLDGARDWLTRNPDADDARKKLAGQNILNFLRPKAAGAKPGGETRSKSARINAIRKGRPTSALSPQEKAAIAAITREP